MNTIVAGSDCSCDPCPSPSGGGSGPPGAPGANGSDGAAGAAGANAFTITTAGFTMPAVSSSVTVAVTDSSWMAVGQIVYVQSAGYFSVNSKPTTTSASLTNLGYSVNVAPTTVVGSGKNVSPGGVKGTDGAAGSQTLNNLSPTTSKGDIIVDNGANNPLASDVRLAVGSNGKALVADSTQAAGVKYATITPNAAANDNNIPRFDGTTGTPLPLQDSKLLITDDGALQSTPSGGNARGSKAVDLQVDRAAVAQVASGADSVVGGGKNNTASGASSTVSGGLSGTASNANATVSGGTSNNATGDTSTVGGGDTNVASGSKSTVAGGILNQSTGQSSSVGGGLQNMATGPNSAVPGGYGAIADKHGQISHAAGLLSDPGDAQTSVLVARGSTADGTPTEIFLDGIALQSTIKDDTTWAFRILIVARRTDVAGESAAYQLLGCIDRGIGVASTALVGSVTKTVIAEDSAGWDVTATADAANGALALTVTGEAAKSVSWVARIELCEVTG